MLWLMGSLPLSHGEAHMDNLPVGSTVYWNPGDVIRKGTLMGRSLVWPQYYKVNTSSFRTVLVHPSQIVKVVFDNESERSEHGT